MNKVKRIYAIILLASVNLNAGYGLAQIPTPNQPQQPQAASTPVSGNGTPGELVKWTGVNGQDTFTIGNSLITENKFGLVGIGTTMPSSKLTVAGTIESLDGGFKFPDGTVQSTAALSSILRDATLIGNGTAGSPLGIAPGGVGAKQLENGSVGAPKLNATSAPVAGQFLGFDGSSLAWQTLEGFTGVVTDRILEAA